MSATAIHSCREPTIARAAHPPYNAGAIDHVAGLVHQLERRPQICSHRLQRFDRHKACFAHSSPLRRDRRRTLFGGQLERGRVGGFQTLVKAEMRAKQQA
jgi:hypothetical protein